MHEVSLMQEILELAVSEAKRNGAVTVHALTVRVGRMSGVDPDALSFAFDVVAAGTPAEGAKLTIITIPVVCFCDPCGCEFCPESFIYRCPRCGQWSQDLRTGDELELSQLEVLTHDRDES